jgi:hypothetical protein
MYWQSFPSLNISLLTDNSAKTVWRSYWRTRPSQSYNGFSKKKWRSVLGRGASVSGSMHCIYWRSEPSVMNMTKWTVACLGNARWMFVWKRTWINISCLYKSLNRMHSFLPLHFISQHLWKFLHISLPFLQYLSTNLYHIFCSSFKFSCLIKMYVFSTWLNLKVYLFMLIFEWYYILILIIFLFMLM